MNADIQEAPVELRQTEELAGDKFVSEEPMSSPGFGDWLETWSRRLDYWRLEAFWLSLFTVMVLAVFAERAYSAVHPPWFISPIQLCNKNVSLQPIE